MQIKRNCLTFIFITGFYFSFAQNHYSDVELSFFLKGKHVYEVDFEDFSKIQEYVKSHAQAKYSEKFLADYLLTEASFLIEDEQMRVSDAILDSAYLYIETNDHFRKGVYYLYKGTVSRHKFLYTEGLSYYDSATTCLSQVSDVDTYLIKTDLEKGFLYYQQSNFEKATELFDAVILKDNFNIDALLAISLIHSHREYFEKFLEVHSILSDLKHKMSQNQLEAFYFQKSQYFRHHNDYDSVIYYCELGKHYDMIGWIMAERKLYDSAKYYFNKSLDRYSSTNGTYYEMKVIVSLAYMDLYQGDTIQLAQRMNLLKKQYKNHIAKDPTYIILKGTVANERGDFKEAYNIYKEFIDEAGNYIEPQMAIEIFNKLINIYPELDDLDDALAFNQLFIQKIKTSIENRYGTTQSQVFNNLNRINIKFLESSLKINDVKEKLLSEEKRGQNLKKIVFFALMGTLILASFLTYIYIAQKRIKHLNNRLNGKAEVLNMANRDKDMLLAVISHQIKAPLANIMYFLDLSKTLIKDGNIEELNRFLNTLFDAVNSSYKRVIDILKWLNIANKGYFSDQQVYLKELLEEILEFYRSDIEEKKIDALLTVDEKSLFETNKEAVKIIFQNLIENAVRYTSHGGKIVISEESLNDGKLLNIENDHSEEFDNGKNKHADSTGMGLIIVKDLCEKLNIKLKFQSNKSDTKVALEFNEFNYV